MREINEDQIEGRNSVSEALRSGRPINKIYLKKGERHGAILKIISMAKKSGIPIQEMDESVFSSMAKTSNHQGILAKAASKGYSSVDEILKNARDAKENPFVLILNELTDPQNLGGILRTVDGLGAHGVIIPKNRACGITPTVGKVSSGAVEYVKVARVTNIARTIDELKKEGLWIIGADADGKDYFKVDLTGPVALVVGGEDKGLGTLVKKKCDILVRIPLRGRITSLNAAVAASILGYDILRQRIGRHGQTT
ncbi:MAG: 23S rRNA (guanosine(2251)-2'-O)-methyltransferase RlmB [Tepidanaerobacteraceae bacterium]|nr:23S rRNA (guanosine(2251)-2'-O)-methyltransferase RlmB [Tepidanaerobacteraceae bacterium]